MSVADAIATRIRRNGPITFAELQELALYHPDGGFFTGGHGAGRAGGDFVTSPEVGPLFGALVARSLDDTWRALGRPDPFVVVEAGAGNGRLASDVLRAEPDCALALRYVLVERSPELRARQRERLTLEPADEALGPMMRTEDPDGPDELVEGMGPITTTLDDLPGVPFTGVVLANELLDNLPVRIVERSADGWAEVRVGLGDGGTLVESIVPADPELTIEADEVAGGTRVPLGARLPVPEAAAEWLAAAAFVLRRGTVVLVDYAAPVAELLARGADGWLRTYREHGRGAGPFDAPGTQDLTCDVPLEYLATVARRAGFEIDRDTTQAEWLRELGVDELVDEGRATWRERAHLGDLEAIAGRSRIGEAEALTDPAGLGAHRVVVLSKGLHRRYPAA
ncbi:MAG: SAM-dependent methyltransferase [Acidimicrobiia bacterium]